MRRCVVQGEVSSVAFRVAEQTVRSDHAIKHVIEERYWGVFELLSVSLSLVE